MASRVVPGKSNAITRSSPISVLISVDLPTFGRPTIASLMRWSCSPSSTISSSAGGSARSFSANSIRSTMPSPCAAEIG
ncbi:hypothetical protein D3C78_1696050 [compost metagenome]